MHQKRSVPIRRAAEEKLLLIVRECVVCVCVSVIGGRRKSCRNHVVDSFDDFLFNYSLGELFGQLSKFGVAWR